MSQLRGDQPAPAPSHPIAGGRAGPNLLALALVSKYDGHHLPLHRQSAIYIREGIEIDVSTLADWSARWPRPPCPWSRRSAPTRSRPSAFTPTTRPCRCWRRRRPDRAALGIHPDMPFGGRARPAAAFLYSPDRSGAHPERHLASFAGLMQADAYAGFNRLYAPGRAPGPIIEAACWAHARRKFYELAQVAKAPIATEAVTRIDWLFAIERAIHGQSAEARSAARAASSAPILAELKSWLRAQRERTSRKFEIGKAIDYALKRWSALTRFMADGRICLSNNAAERALRGTAVGRHNWTFVGSDRGGERAAAMYTLIESAKLNGIDPQAWLADVLAACPITRPGASTTSSGTAGRPRIPTPETLLLGASHPRCSPDDVRWDAVPTRSACRDLRQALDSAVWLPISGA